MVLLGVEGGVVETATEDAREPLIDSLLLRICESICHEVNFMRDYISKPEKAEKLFVDKSIFGPGLKLSVLLTTYVTTITTESIGQKYSQKINKIQSDDKKLTQMLSKVGTTDEHALKFYVSKVKKLDNKLLIALAVFGHFYPRKIYLRAILS